MHAKEVKAFIHRNRVADVVNALNNAGFKNISLADAQGMLSAINNQEQRYSIEIGQKVVNEVKIELVCDTESRVAEAVTAILEHAKTGQPSAGWIYITEIQSAIEITG